METEFKIKTEGFEGPLELLLDLVEKRKLHINDLSLSQVADDFIVHTKSYQNFPLADSADFILIASTLLLIKSKSLLPNLELTEEEKGNIKDLEKRLVLHKRFKDLSSTIARMFGENSLYFPDESKIIYKVFHPTAEISKDSLFTSIKNIISNIPKPEKLTRVTIQKVISLEEMIENLTKRVNKSIKMSFRDFSRFGKGDKVTIIVSFLAMLELVKQGIVRVNQERHFSDIDMEAEKISVPQYN